jgi:hypothetical protein
MKIARRICIVLTALGALMLAVPRDQSFDVVPFPATGLTVKMTAEIAHDGDYHLVSAMPVVGQQVALSEETVPCELAVTLVRTGQPPITNEITSISRYAEFGFGRIQYYKSANWHLRRGEYEISIAGVKDCPAAVSRGATVSIEESASHITERFLTGVLRYWREWFCCALVCSALFCVSSGGPTSRCTLQPPHQINPFLLSVNFVPSRHFAVICIHAFKH